MLYLYRSVILYTIGNPGSLCVTRDITQVNYREHMRRSLGLNICWKMEAKIDSQQTRAPIDPKKHDFFRENRIQSLNKHAKLVEHEFI